MGTAGFVKNTGAHCTCISEHGSENRGSQIDFPSNAIYNSSAHNSTTPSGKLAFSCHVDMVLR